MSIAAVFEKFSSSLETCEPNILLIAFCILHTLSTSTFCPASCVSLNAQHCFYHVLDAEYHCIGKGGVNADRPWAGYRLTFYSYY